MQAACMPVPCHAVTGSVMACWCFYAAPASACQAAMLLCSAQGLGLPWPHMWPHFLLGSTTTSCSVVPKPGNVHHSP